MENKPSQKPEPKRVLMLADFACATGFAQVSQNIAAQLLNSGEFQIDVVAINYHGMPSEWHKIFPAIRIFPAAYISGGDLFGRNGYLNLLSSGAYDLTFILQDTFQIEPIGSKIVEIRNSLQSHGKKTFKWIFYYPIDAQPKENWISKSAMLADVPVAYTEYGKSESVKLVPEIEYKLKVIPHGINEKVFYPLNKEVIAEFKKDYFLGRTTGKYLVTNINRNQPRKDIARTMQIFRLFKNQVPQSVLYLHMKANDVAYNLHEMARNFELIPDEDYIIPKDFDENTGLSEKIVNAIYNASDLVMTTTLGEGWGLSMTESMATKTPVIAPNHSSLTEMLADGRGMLITAGKRQSDWIALQYDNERVRPVVDVAEFVDKMVFLHNNPDVAKEMAEKAYSHVINNLTWDIVGKKWLETFKEALIVKKKPSIGRNDLCFCGSGKKYKHCHLKYE